MLGWMVADIFEVYMLVGEYATVLEVELVAFEIGSLEVELA